MRHNNVVVFTCNWDGLSCIEAAAQNRLGYSASVKLVKVSCLSRVHSGLILKAFELGADGVMLLGCRPESCLYEKDENLSSKEYEKALSLMELLGLGTSRLRLSRLPRGDGDAFIKEVEDFIGAVSRASYCNIKS
ncbi:MAG TPA: hydrogenase iron-sulfur subunit [Dehalococcoidia bacterium]|jgi:coenzyme F420-reducing hydrogenase delta subunit